MTKVCHVSSAHNRYDVRILKKECCSLAQNGFETYFLVNDIINDETVNGVHIVSTNFFPKNRFQRMFLSLRILYKKAMKIDADIYHFHDPELLLLAFIIKKKK